MTSFKDLFKAMMGNKFIQMTYLLGINVVAVIISMIWSAISNSNFPFAFFSYAMMWSMVAYLFAFVRLSVIQERMYTRDTFRLIPASDTKFYLTNMLTSFIAMLYVVVVEWIIYAITLSFSWNDVQTMLHQLAIMNGKGHFDYGEIISGFASMILVFIIIGLLAWATISLIHLLTKAGTNFLPSRGNGIITAILYIIIIMIVLRVVGYVTGFIQNTSIFSSVTSSSDVISYWLNVGLFALIAVVESVLNIYLLGHWVETISES